MFQQNVENESISSESKSSEELIPNSEITEPSGEKEKTNEAPKEISVVQEQPGAQIQQNSQTDDQQNTNDDFKPADETEIKEELSSATEKGDRSWAKKAKSVIHEFEEEPYSEEEAAEDLQVEYLDQRFGVKINKKEHEKK
jgi:hypothetical protein